MRRNFTLILLVAAIAASSSTSLQGQEINPAAAFRIDQNEDEFTTIRSAYVRAQRRTRAGSDAAQQAEALLEKGLKQLAMGRSGEARRNFHHGMTLLRGRQWTAREEFSSSLALRAGFTVFDPAWPFAAQLTQVFPAPGVFSAEPRVRLSIHRAAPLAQGATRLGAKVRDLGLRGVSFSDVIDAPLRLEADLSGLPDGLYGLVCEVLDGDTPVCTIAKSIYAVRGLAGIQSEVEGLLRGVEGHQSLKATIRYPFDFARRMNSGLREPRHEDLASLVAKSKTLARDLAQGKDPIEGAKGDHTRHYYLKEADAILPYRLFVPSAYNGRELPLVIALHGNGGSENTMIDRDKSQLKALAERYSFIAACPVGYRPSSNFGLARSPEQANIPALMRTPFLAEHDVMNVVERVQREYRVNKRRIYLLGHSGGGGGTWVLGVQHAELWAALAPIASAFSSPDLDLTRIKNIPVLIAHGTKDDVAPIKSSREMFERLKQAGGSPRFVEIPGATHDSAVQAVLPQVFEFFQKVAR